MKHSSTFYVGLDVHKESIAVAYVSDAKGVEVLYLGSIGPASATSRSSSAGFTPRVLSWCLCTRPAAAAIGVSLCHLEAPPVLGGGPSLIPKKPGGKVKTDRRDAVRLARLRTGDQPIWPCCRGAPES